MLIIFSGGNSLVKHSSSVMPGDATVAGHLSPLYCQCRPNASLHERLHHDNDVSRLHMFYNQIA
jgi:hypothetical protein